MSWPRPRVPDLFIGREAELTALQAECASVGEHGCRAILLTGDPGIGKTHLTMELIARQGPETIVLRARAYPLGGTSSLGLWVEALDGHLRQFALDRRRDLAGPSAGVLAGLLPSLAELPADPAPTRLHLLRGLADLLDRLAERVPVIVVLDDAHLADGSSWEALGYVVRALQRSAVLIVLTARPAELTADPVASEVLLGLEQERLARRLPIGPLDTAELATLARSMTGRAQVPDTLVNWVMARSRGTPLFAAGLLRALLEEGADLTDPVLRTLPEDLLERILLGLRRLEPAGRALLEMLTVLGSRVAIAELVDLCGQSLDAVAGALDDLVRQRLVVAVEQGAALSYEIGHPLYAEAVYAGIGAARRRALHRHIGRTLVRSGRSGAGAAHLIRSADPGDPEAVEALIAALSDTEARDLHRESLALLAGLVDLLPAGDARWLAVDAAMARQPEWVVDHRIDLGCDAAAEAMRRIEALLATSPDGARRAAVKFNLAVFVGWGQGDIASARQLAAEAAVLFAGAGERRGELLARNESGYLDWIAGDMAAFEVAAREVLAGGEQLDDRFVTLQGLCSLAHNRQLAGRLAESATILSRAIDLATADGHRHRASYLLGQRAWSHALLGRTAAAYADLRDGQIADPDYRTTVLLDYGMHLDWLAGALRSCVTTFTDQLAWTGGHSRRRALGSCVAAIGAAELGEAELARATVAGGAAVIGGSDLHVVRSDQVRWADGVVSWLAGDGVAAVASLRSAWQRQHEGGWGAGPFARFVTADLAEIAARTGDGALASIVAEQVHEAERVDSGPALGGLTTMAAGAAALAGGDPEAALERLTSADSALLEANWPLTRARALALTGRTHATAARRVDAEDALRGALEEFERLGAVVRARWVAEELRRLSARGRRSAAEVAGPGALSRREREVARLACSGAGAKEIAHALFISERTVETHLASVYTKLGIRSRRELVDMATHLDP